MGSGNSFQDVFTDIYDFKTIIIIILNGAFVYILILYRMMIRTLAFVEMETDYHFINRYLYLVVGRFQNLFYIWVS